MDSFTKVVEGTVKQYFEKQSNGKFICVSQEFVFDGGEVICYEGDFWNDPIDPPTYEYQSYDMVV